VLGVQTIESDVLADLGSPTLLYIAQEATLLVGYNRGVLVGLQGGNATRIQRVLDRQGLAFPCGVPGDYVPQAPELFMVDR